MLRRIGRHLALSAVTGLAIALAADCFTPTQLLVSLTTDLPCPPAERGVLVVGRADLLAGGKPTREVATSSCAEARADLGGGLRSLGSLTLVPSDDAERFTLRVAISRTEGGSAGCLDGRTDRKECVIAQRSSRFLSNKKLELPIFLSSACLGVDCPPDAKGNPQTCERGQCVSALIDPCSGPECAPPAPVDASSADVGAGDAQEDVVTVEAGTDAKSLGDCEWARGVAANVSPPATPNRLVATTWGLFWKAASSGAFHRMTLPPAAQVETQVEASVVEATASATAAYYRSSTQVFAAFPDGGKAEVFPGGGGAGTDVPILLAASGSAAYGVGPTGGAFAYRPVEMTVTDVKGWPELPILPVGTRYGKELLVWSGKQIFSADANRVLPVYDVTSANPAVDIVDVTPTDTNAYRALVALSNGQIVGIPPLTGNPVPLATAPGTIHEIAADAEAFYFIVSQAQSETRVYGRRFDQLVAPYPISSTGVAQRGLASLGSCVYFFEGTTLVSAPRPSGGNVVLP